MRMPWPELERRATEKQNKTKQKKTLLDNNAEAMYRSRPHIGLLRHRRRRRKIIIRRKYEEQEKQIINNY
jgi:hypothetical protein